MTCCKLSHIPGPMYEDWGTVCQLGHLAILLAVAAWQLNCCSKQCTLSSPVTLRCPSTVASTSSLWPWPPSYWEMVPKLLQIHSDVLFLYCFPRWLCGGVPAEMTSFVLSNVIVVNFSKCRLKMVAFHQFATNTVDSAVIALKMLLLYIIFANYLCISCFPLYAIILHIFFSFLNVWI